MNKIVSQIRDLSTIEKELSTNPAGVLAINVDNEKVAQLATTFLYQDKNVYLFFDDDDEFFEGISFETNVSFTIIKNDKVKKSKKNNIEPTYSLLAISVNGMMRKVEEQKTIEELKQNYLRKYGKSDGDDLNFPSLNNVVIIDSEEIQAFEETGG